MLIDTDKLYAEIDKRIAACGRTLEQGMFPQVFEDVREERRELRELRAWLDGLVDFARRHTRHRPETRAEDGK